MLYIHTHIYVCIYIYNPKLCPQNIASDQYILAIFIAFDYFIY